MLFKFTKKPSESAPETVDAAVSTAAKAASVPTSRSCGPQDREAELARRESMLNARLAAFEAAQRRQAELTTNGVRSSEPLPTDLDAQLAELQEIAEKLESREKKIAELAADLRERETALTQRRRALDAQEREIDKKRAEAERISLRLVAVQQEIDAKERLFEERSQRALDTIMRQKESLQQLRKAA